jgi:hypothetical protein
VGKLDAQGNFAHIHRILGQGVVMVGETRFNPFELDRSANAVVGTIGPPIPSGTTGALRQQVIPLTDGAIRVLGGYSANYTIAVANLAPVRPEEFATPAKAKPK